MTEQKIKNQKLPLSGALFTAFICVLFGSNAVAIKITLEGVGVFTSAGMRFGMASLAISLWALSTRKPFIIRKGQFYHLFIIGMIFFVQLSLFYFGISKTNASRATLFVNLQPFFLLVLAHYFIAEDQVSKKKLLGILVGFSGVAFVFLEKKGITSDFQTGDLIVLSAAFLWACNGVYTKRIIANFEPFHLVLYPMMIATPLFFLGGFLFDGIMISEINPRVVLSLLYQAVVTGSFGFIAWVTLLKKYGAVSLHSFIFIMPVAGVLLGGLVLGEPITAKILLALLLIVSGIFIVNLKWVHAPT
ncbi:MAG: DMT family transporter [Desulfobacterales bacterium]|nr:DMT family transporter [Desulfobacterales bacterium]MDX2509341.1 DMT family transporter [Desulfobacterales bacterium]